MLLSRRQATSNSNSTKLGNYALFFTFALTAAMPSSCGSVPGLSNGAATQSVSAAAIDDSFDHLPAATQAQLIAEIGAMTPMQIFALLEANTSDQAVTFEGSVISGAHTKLLAARSNYEATARIYPTMAAISTAVHVGIAANSVAEMTGRARSHVNSLGLVMWKSPASQAECSTMNIPMLKCTPDCLSQFDDQYAQPFGADTRALGVAIAKARNPDNAAAGTPIHTQTQTPAIQVGQTALYAILSNRQTGAVALGTSAAYVPGSQEFVRSCYQYDPDQLLGSGPMYVPIPESWSTN